MNVSKKERNLLIFVSVFVILAVFAPLSLGDFAVDYKRQKEDEQKILINQIADYDGKVVGIEDQRRLLRANRESYISWVEKGLVGTQDNLSFVKLMQRIQESRLLNPISYDLKEEIIESDKSPLTEGSSANIVVSRLDLKMPMLHDLDIFMFLNDLVSQSNRIILPVDCSLTRIGNDFSLENKAKISSRCELGLLSILDPEVNIQSANKEKEGVDV